MRQTVPMVIADADVLSSNLSEDATYSAWSSGTTYATGDYAYLASTHRVYRSTQGSNLNHNPDGDDGTWWVVDSWTNYWKAIAQDTARPTVAEDTSGIEYEIEADGTYTTVAFKGLKSASVQVVVKNASAVTVSDTTKTATKTVNGLSWFRGDMVFDGLTIEDGYTIEITIADTGVTDVLAEVAQIIVGRTFVLGTTSPDDSTLGFQDFSLREQDQFGGWEVTERGVALVANFSFWHLATRTWWVKDMFVANRAKPCLYWGGETTEDGKLNLVDAGLFVFGYAKEPSTPTKIGYATTTVEVIGLAFDNPGSTVNIAGGAEPQGDQPAKGTFVAAMSGWLGTDTVFNTTAANVQLDTKDIDYNWGWTAGDDTFTVPANVNTLEITFHAENAGGSWLTTGIDVEARVKIDGTEQLFASADGQKYTFIHLNDVFSVTEGDTVEIMFRVTAGAANVTLHGSERRTYIAIKGYFN